MVPKEPQVATVPVQKVQCISFSVNIKPVPQARPRFFVRHNGLRTHVGAYDPKHCKSFKEVIAWHAKTKAMELGLKEPLKGAIVISLIFQMGTGKEVMSKKKDIDNLAKAVMDALRGVLYKDDSQIVEAHLYKLCGEPQVKITLKEVSR